MDDITINGYTIAWGWVVLYAVVVLALAVVYLIAYTNVIARAGYSRWWILILLVPVVNLIMLFVFCFKEWPVTREVRELRAQLVAAQRGYGAGGPYAGPPPGGTHPYAVPPAPGSYPGPPSPHPPTG